jgi:hypothetical protein
MHFQKFVKNLNLLLLSEIYYENSENKEKVVFT